MRQSGSRYARSLVFMMPDCDAVQVVAKVDELLPQIATELTVCLAYKEYQWIELESIAIDLCVLNSPHLAKLEAFIASMLEPAHCIPILQAYKQLKSATTICIESCCEHCRYTADPGQNCFSRTHQRPRQVRTRHDLETGATDRYFDAHTSFSQSHS